MTGKNLVLLTCVACCALSAQTSAPTSAQISDVPVFSTDARLALIGFHVTAKKQYVTGLTASDFELLEDGLPKPITVFEGGQGSASPAPVEIILLFDNSGSVRNLDLLDEKLFRDNLLASLPEATLSVYSFQGRLSLRTAPTRDPGKLRQAFQSVLKREPADITFEIGAPGKDSLIYEAIAAVAKHESLETQPATRLLVVISDGIPGGEMDPAHAVAAATDAGLSVYPLVVGHEERADENRRQTEIPARPGASQEETAILVNYLNAQFQKIEEQVRTFTGIADSTGGIAFDPPRLDAATAREIIEFLAAQVRFEYIVGFSPEAEVTPRPHKLEVRLKGHKGARLTGAAREVIH